MTRIERQIEMFRKGDVAIRVKGVGAGVPISVDLERHEFLFGCTVPGPSGFAGARHPSYQARLHDVFNAVVPPSALTDPGVLRVDVLEPTPLGRLRLRLDHAASAALPLHVHVGGKAAGMNSALAETEAGRRVVCLYMLCFAHPTVKGIFWSGLADGEDATGPSGLLRGDLAPKYAFKALQKTIHFQWHSRASGHTDAEGLFRFRGFFGKYRVVVDAAGLAALVGTLDFSCLCKDRLFVIEPRPGSGLICPVDKRRITLVLKEWGQDP